MKIGTIFDPSQSNSHYRVIAPLSEMERRGHEVVKVAVRSDAGFSATPLWDCDVVHIYRRAERSVLKVAGALRERGIGIVWDDDDDPRLIPPESGKIFEQLGGLEGERLFQSAVKVMKKAHVVTACSEYLAERFRVACPGTVVALENHTTDEQFNRDARAHDGVVIGWVARAEHRADVQNLELTKTLGRVLSANPNAKVVTVGIRLNIDEPRYTHIRQVPFSELPSYIRQFDIGIAPLSDILMNYGRSNVKVKEYAAAGVPWVASNRGAIASLGPRSGGIAIADDEWETTLTRLVRSRLGRLRLRRQAAAWGRSQSIDQHADGWEREWKLAADSARPQLADSVRA